MISIKLRKLKKLFRSDAIVPYLYLGRDLITKRNYEKQLGDKYCILNVSRLHNAIADQIRKEYVAWVDTLNYLNAKEIDWWFNNISSRDLDYSNIFQDFVYFELIKKIYSEQAAPTEKPRLLIVESLAVAKNIKDWLSLQKINVNVIAVKSEFTSLLTNCLNLLHIYIKYLTVISLRYFAAIFSRILYKKKKIDTNSTIIIDTYFRKSNITEAGEFSDTYFPYLYEYLKKQGYSVLVHPKFFEFKFNYFLHFIRLRKSKTNFIIREDFLTASDYLRALFYPLRFLSLPIKAPEFRGLNTRKIIIEEKLSHSFIPCMEALLTYRLFIRLKREFSCPAEIIQWFENQAIDKALIAGSRQSFPEAKIVGAQIFIHSLNYVSLSPSQSEVKANVIPDILLETSSYQCKLASLFTDGLSCFPVASLRYAHVFCESKNRMPNHDKIFLNRLLVLLPYGVMESVELLEIIIESVSNLSSRLDILVKPHPTTKLQLVLNYLPNKRLPDNFIIFSGNLKDACLDASMVISAASSTMAETITRGLPVIFLGRKNALSLNPFSGINIPFVSECFTSDELIPAIKKYIDTPQDKKVEIWDMGIKLRELFFTPVNDKTLEPFIMLAKKQ